MTNHTNSHRQNIVEIINQNVENMTEKHSKVLPVRLDVRYPEGHPHDGTNHDIQHLNKNIVQHYRNNGIECRYVCVREQESSENPHYHALLLLDGNKVQSPAGVVATVNEKWKDIVSSPKDGLVHFCRHHPDHHIPSLEMIRRPSSNATGEILEQQRADFEKAKDVAVKHGDYLAKERTKGHAPSGVREVLASQVRRK